MSGFDLKFWLGNAAEWLGAVSVMMIAGISPLLQRVRRIEFRFPRREATFSLSLFALIYFFAYQYFANDSLTVIRKIASAFEGGEVAERMLLAAICLFPFIVVLVLRGQPLKSIGWGRENLRAGLLVGLMLGVLVIFLRSKFTTLLKGITPAQGSLLLVILILSLAEETIFRGYLQLRFSTWLGSTWGWLATAGLYFLWQLPGRLWLRPFSELWVELVLALVQGLLLGWIMRKTVHVTAPALFRTVSTWLLFL